MAMTMSVDLGVRLEQVVGELVAQGRYNSKSEVLREGVRLVQEREARLAEFDAAVMAGVAEADAGHLLDIDEVFGRIEARLRAAIDKER
jgi:antitoxin ParD1/3/4